MQRDAYRSHDYPTEMVDLAYRPNGDRIVIRPILPEDRELLVTFFRDLSPEDRCHRFLHPVSELSAALLQQLTQIERGSHFALVAETLGKYDGTVICEARYVRAGEQSSEIAISVAESWRGSGIAKFMIAELEWHAAAAGVRQFVGYTLDSNAKALSLARKRGFSIFPGIRGVIRLEKILVAEARA